MKTYLRKVVKFFKQFADSKLLTFAQHVTASMATAVAEFPSPTPTLAEVNAELANYATLLQTAAGRDKVQVSLKNQSKQTLLLMLSQLADYVNLTAQGNDATLTMSGYELNKVPEPVKLTAPVGVALTDGGNSGELVLKCKSVPGASSYKFEYTTDVTLEENSWESITATTTAFMFTGLTKGATYYCRVVAVGSNKQQMNSIVVNRISQ
jgi:hypothetical protein